MGGVAQATGVGVTVGVIVHDLSALQPSGRQAVGNLRHCPVLFRAKVITCAQLWGVGVALQPRSAHNA